MHSLFVDDFGLEVTEFFLLSERSGHIAADNAIVVDKQVLGVWANMLMYKLGDTLGPSPNIVPWGRGLLKDVCYALSGGPQEISGPGQVRILRRDVDDEVALLADSNSDGPVACTRQALDHELTIGDALVFHGLAPGKSSDQALVLAINWQQEKRHCPRTVLEYDVPPETIRSEVKDSATARDKASIADVKIGAFGE